MSRPNDTPPQLRLADETTAAWLAERPDTSDRKGADKERMSRRRLLGRAAVGAGLFGLLETVGRVEADTPSKANISSRESMKITRLDTFVLKNSWVFVKISTNVGIVGWGEMLKDRSKTCAAGAKQVESYLLGKDPRRVVHHWQAIYRHAFYRGGPVLTSVLSGIDQALWDIKGKALGMPIYELFGGPTRDKIRVQAVKERPSVDSSTRSRSRREPMVADPTATSRLLDSLSGSQRVSLPCASRWAPMSTSESTFTARCNHRRPCFSSRPSSRTNPSFTRSRFSVRTLT